MHDKACNSSTPSLRYAAGAQGQGGAPTWVQLVHSAMSAGLHGLSRQHKLCLLITKLTTVSVQQGEGKVGVSLCISWTAR